MSVDVDVLRHEAEQLRREWDAGAWLPSRTAAPKSNPGAVAERCLALIAEVIEFRKGLVAQPKIDPATTVLVTCPRHGYNKRLSDLAPGSTIPLCCGDVSVSFEAEVQ